MGVHMFYVWVHQLGKRTRMQEDGIWIAPPDYYRGQEEQGYISLELQVSMEEAKEAVPDQTKSGVIIFQKHFDLVHKQL